MNRGRWVGILIACAVMFTVSSCGPAKGTPSGEPASQKGKQPASAASAPLKGKPAAAKKVFAPGMGGLTVRVVNAKDAAIPVRIKAFFASDQRSSVFRALFPSNAAQELPAGTYDLEIDTIPPRIYKGVTVSAGKETVQDMGCLAGTLVVKALNSKQKPAAYPVKVLFAGTKTAVTAAMANRAVEVGPGSYDIEVGITPVLIKKDIKVANAKETAVDLGCVTGELMVTVVGEDGKDKRVSVRIRKAGSTAVIATGASNRPFEVAEGRYDLEIGLVPAAIRKDVEVKAGAVTTVDLASGPQAKQ